MIRTATDNKAFMVGGGIGSMAAAAFIIRDGGVPGSNITIYEALPVLGGSLDGAGNPKDGYSMRGGRMLTTDNYECTWGLFKSIPSLIDPNRSVFDETIAFNEQFRSHSRARLVDGNRAIADVTSMGFTMKDRLELVRLAEASEKKLGASRITDWLSPEFFTTPFAALAHCSDRAIRCRGVGKAAGCLRRLCGSEGKSRQPARRGG
jgi:oleate hydratase